MSAAKLSDADKVAQLVDEVRTARAATRRWKRLIGEIDAISSAEALSVLRESLHSKNARKVSAAQYMLADIGTDEAIKVLADSLEYVDGTGVATAGRLLASVKNDEARRCVILCLERRRHELGEYPVRELARALRGVPDLESVRVVEPMLRSHSAQTRRVGVGTLVTLPLAESTLVLEKAAESQGVFRGRQARRALRYLRERADGATRPSLEG